MPTYMQRLNKLNKFAQVLVQVVQTIRIKKIYKNVNGKKVLDTLKEM